MNEKIKQLVKQAEQYALDRANEGSDEDYDYAFDDDFRQKFAELIVLECMQVVRNGINNTTDWDSSSWDQCCENRIYAIQRHFGVDNE